MPKRKPPGIYSNGYLYERDVISLDISAGKGEDYLMAISVDLTLKDAKRMRNDLDELIAQHKTMYPKKESK